MMILEPEQESCGNCRWSRDVPEKWQQKVRDWDYEAVLEEDLPMKVVEKKKLLDLVYGMPVINCVSRHCFVGAKYCCRDWEPKQQWYKVLPEDMQLIKNLLSK